MGSIAYILSFGEEKISISHSAENPTTPNVEDDKFEYLYLYLPSADVSFRRLISSSENRNKKDKRKKEKDQKVFLTFKVTSFHVLHSFYLSCLLSLGCSQRPKDQKDNWKTQG